MSYVGFIAYIKERFPRAGMAILNPTICEGGNTHIYGLGTIVVSSGYMQHDNVITPDTFKFLTILEQYYDFAIPLNEFLKYEPGSTIYDGTNLRGIIVTPVRKLTQIFWLTNGQLSCEMEVFANAEVVEYQVKKYLDARYNERKNAEEIVWEILPQPIAEEIAEYL